MSSTPLYFAAHLLAAVLFGSLVGLERQWRQRMAGTRTNAMVAAGVRMGLSRTALTYRIKKLG
jgi:uncharacterized membrane protein YhiD involved in acid resistance